uniref:Uncharacterized protein n=1 Tax=Ananas comosus var. bracteatus TaxID=296719 RepID=A0A6V7PPG7_ANACO|nr:unnamed protein product [Ananas comosus var. bracteatus]
MDLVEIESWRWIAFVTKRVCEDGSAIRRAVTKLLKKRTFRLRFAWRAEATSLRCSQCADYPRMIDSRPSRVKRESIFILTLTSDSEHRLSHDLITAIRSVLTRVNSEFSSFGVGIGVGAGMTKAEVEAKE